LVICPAGKVTQKQWQKCSNYWWNLVSVSTIIMEERHEQANKGKRVQKR